MAEEVTAREPRLDVLVRYGRQSFGDRRFTSGAAQRMALTMSSSDAPLNEGLSSRWRVTRRVSGRRADAPLADALPDAVIRASLRADPRSSLRVEIDAEAQQCNGVVVQQTSRRRLDAPGSPVHACLTRAQAVRRLSPCDLRCSQSPECMHE